MVVRPRADSMDLAHPNAALVELAVEVPADKVKQH